jgi:hypothetical protein
MDFSVSILLNTKVDNFSWLLTIVYGPVFSCKKSSFLSELKTIAQLGHDSWLIGGDFNMIRKRVEKQGKTFQYKTSSRFNLPIHDLNLMELTLIENTHGPNQFINILLLF